MRIKDYKSIHFVGIGGVSMSSLAEIMFDRGYFVSGSDRSLGEVTAHLQKRGIKIFEGHAAQNVHGADLVVYTAAVKADNPERVEAARLGIPSVERAEFMGTLLQEYKCRIGVCGTHGKTTATSMLTMIFVTAKLNPTALIGAKLPAIDANFLSGGGNYAIFESCEYVDSFLNFPTDLPVILNIEEDHLDYFKDIEAIKASFLKYASKGEKAIFNADNKNCLEVAEEYKGRAIYFSLIDPDADFYAKPQKGGFDAFENGKLLGRVRLAVSGTHNVYNALAALAAARVCKIDFEDIAEALSTFHGAARRFESKGDYGFLLVDDYAHHPSEIEASLNAARQITSGKIYCIFQPHTYTRTYALFDDFVRALSEFDKCLLVDIYSAREADTGKVSSKTLAEKIPGALYADSFDMAADYVVKNAKAGDTVITMGAGNVCQICDIIKKRLG